MTERKERDVAFDLEDIEGQSEIPVSRVVTWADNLIRNGFTGETPFLTKKELDEIIAKIKEKLNP